MAAQIFEESQITSQPLVDIILQGHTLENFDRKNVENIKKSLKAEKEERLKTAFYSLSEQLPFKDRHCLLQASEKGASSWLTALPLDSQGYTLNKREFRDSVCLRYGWNIADIPRDCACGKKNSIDHALTCSLGGYVHLRHNNLRDLLAEMLVDAKCRDVVVEPPLVQVNPDRFKSSTNTQPEARLDIAATGVHGTFERTFFDVRVTHPNCESNIHKTLPQLYKEHEDKKKRMYEERILEAEKGSFTPLVFSTSGGKILIKKLATRIADGKNEKYEDVIYHLRVRIRYAILRSTLLAIRGQRGRKLRNVDSIEETFFNIIPEAFNQRKNH